MFIDFIMINVANDVGFDEEDRNDTLFFSESLATVSRKPVSLKISEIIRYEPSEGGDI